MLPITSIIQQHAWGAIHCAATPPYAITAMNEVVGRWSASSEAAAIGQPLAQLIPAARGEWLAALTRALTSHSSAQVDKIIGRWPDGEDHHLAIYCIPVFAAEDQQPTNILSLLVDLSQSEPASVDEARLNQVGESFALLPVPVWIFDAKGRLRAANNATLHRFEVETLAQFIQLVGPTASAQFTRLQPRLTSSHIVADVTAQSTRATVNRAEQRTPSETPIRWTGDLRRARAVPIRPGELAPIRALQRRAITTQQLISLVHPTQQTEIMFEVSAAPILNAQGDLIGAIAVTIDITGRMLQDGQRDAILSMLGHDLRNPLTPAIFYLQQVQKKLSMDPNYEQEANFALKIMEQLDRIFRISVDIDAFVSMIHGGPAPERSMCDIVALCRELAARQIERRPQNPVVIDAPDPTMFRNFAQKYIERALIILIASAARRSPPGREVLIRLRTQAGKVKVEIRDHGKPFDAEQLLAVRQVLGWGGAALGLTDGTDLDLSIVQTILSLYRSELLVASSPRQGTTFWFSLALPAPEPPAKEGSQTMKV